MEVYDLGGISSNTTDRGLLNIKRFKEGFSCPVSLRGRLALYQ